MIQNLWHTAKAVLRGKFIAIQYYLMKQEKSQITQPYYLKQPEKEQRIPKVRRKEIIKITAKIEAKKTTEKKINETKS